MVGKGSPFSGKETCPSKLNKGSGGRTQPKCPAPSKGLFTKNGKTYMRVPGSSFIRDQLIPSPGPNINTTIFCADEFDKIMNFATTEPKDPEEVLNEIRKDKMELAKASAKRVAELKKFNLVAGPTTDSEADLVKQDKAKVDYAIKRSKEIKLDQKDEVKICNKIILEAKCQAVRQNQIVEHELRKKELKKVQDQEIEMMYQKMMDEAEKYEKEKAITQEKKKNYVLGVKAQIDENVLKRQIEQEQLMEEGRLNTEAMYREIIDMTDQQNKKRQEQAETRRKINEYNNNTIMLLKTIENEENRIEDLKIQEYLQFKADREQAIEDEKMKQKKEKEKMVNEVREKQRKSMAAASTREAMHDQYVNDLVERKWRQDERDKKIKELIKKKDMIDSIEEQKNTRLKMRAIEMQRGKEEFAAIISVLEKEEEKEKQENERKKMLADRHRVELMNQINDKENEKIEEIKKRFLERRALETARDLEIAELREHVDSKIQKALDSNLPESYAMEIRRQMAKNKLLM